MSKILITSLGTGIRKKGEYQTTIYQINGKTYEEKSLSKALCEHLDLDIIFMIGTKRSIWDGIYEEFGGDNIEIQYDLLNKQNEGILTQKDLQPILDLWEKKFNMNSSKCFLIDYGLDDKEIWSNFSVYLEIAQLIKNGDILYLDITHSFRSLSLMSYIMLNFIKSIHQTDFKIAGIFYGMYEYIYEPSNTNKITPIVDLKILFEIDEWIRAISAFKNYGRAELITQQIKDLRGNDDIIAKYFERFSQSIGIANLGAIFKFIKDMKKKDKFIEKLKLPIIKLVSNDLKSFIDRMDKKSFSAFQLELAQWFFENKNYALSYIALTESIITKVCEESNISTEGEENRQTAKDKLFNDTELSELKHLYLSVNKIRNSIAHQLKNRQDSIVNDVNNLENHITRVKKYFNKIKEIN